MNFKFLKTPSNDASCPWSLTMQCQWIIATHAAKNYAQLSQNLQLRCWLFHSALNCSSWIYKKLHVVFLYFSQCELWEYWLIKHLNATKWQDLLLEYRCESRILHLVHLVDTFSLTVLLVAMSQLTESGGLKTCIKLSLWEFQWNLNESYCLLRISWRSRHTLTMHCQASIGMIW